MRQKKMRAFVEANRRQLQHETSKVQDEHARAG